MSIDPIVPLVEEIVAGQKAEGKEVYFSYRHAQEIHALGVKHEFSAGDPWSQVCVSVLVSALGAPMIWVRILWSRPKLEYPTEECLPREFPLSDAGARSLKEAWPAIRMQLSQAIARGRPPEEPNQSPEPMPLKRHGSS